jgi:adiponectin receptor
VINPCVYPHSCPNRRGLSRIFIAQGSQSKYEAGLPAATGGHQPSAQLGPACHRPRTMSSQQGFLRHRGAHQSHRRRRSSSSSSTSAVGDRRRRPGTVSDRSPSDLISLRLFVLSHIEEVERKLLSLESTNARCLFSDQDQDDASRPESPCRSPPTEEADIYSSVPPSAARSISATPLSEDLDLIVHEGLKRLHHLREEVSARLPDLEELRSHFPDFDWELPNISLVDLRARMPDMPNLSNVGSKLPDLDEYLPTLSERLRSLQSYLSNIPSISSAINLGPLHDLLASELIEDVQASAEKAQTQAECTAAQIMSGLKKSLNGRKLISYHDLPEKWRNNEWVHGGYRFIPLQEWPSLVLSMFTLHNETGMSQQPNKFVPALTGSDMTANIHTHLIPLILFVPSLLYGCWRYTDLNELPTTLYSIFASFCLLSSVVWHTCTGSAHEELMVFTARLDYVGIGWLISANLAIFCWYGFSCRPFALAVYLSTVTMFGIAGSILPFMAWFNARKYKVASQTFQNYGAYSRMSLDMAYCVLRLLRMDRVG